MKVRQSLKLSSYDRENLWWNQTERVADAASLGESLSPFVLKHVTSIGTSCSLCHWSKRCYGCKIDPTTDDAVELKHVLLRNTYLACEWDFDFLDANFDEQGLNWQVHESVDKI